MPEPEERYCDLDVSDEMIERAVLAGSRAEGCCRDGTPCTHTDCHYRAIIEAAFEGIDLTNNYFVGKLVERADLVIIVGKDQMSTNVLRWNGDGMDRLCNHVNFYYRKGVDGRRYIRSVQISKLPPLGQVDADE